MGCIPFLRSVEFILVYDTNAPPTICPKYVKPPLDCSNKKKRRWEKKSDERDILTILMHSIELLNLLTHIAVSGGATYSLPHTILDEQTFVNSPLNKSDICLLYFLFDSKKILQWILLVKKLFIKRGKIVWPNGCHTSPENTKNMWDMKYDWEGVGDSMT